jgi:hypothetical protein
MKSSNIFVKIYFLLPSSLLTTSKGETIKRHGKIDKDPFQKAEDPAWARKKVLRTTSKGKRLSRGESVRVKRGGMLARPSFNDQCHQGESTSEDLKDHGKHNYGGTRRIRLKREKSARLKVQRKNSSELKRNGSGVQRKKSGELKRNGSRKKIGELQASSELKREKSPRSTRGLQQEDSESSDSSVEPALERCAPPRTSSQGPAKMHREGSFRISKNNMSMTINIVKVEEQKPAFGRRAPLRTTSKGERLKKQGSIRMSNVNRMELLAEDSRPGLERKWDAFQNWDSCLRMSLRRKSKAQFIYIS